MTKNQNTQSEAQKKLEYFRQLKSRGFQSHQRPQFTAPKFITTPRRPGMRGK